MKFKDLLKLALRTFRARTGRTLLTVLGMGIGIGAILFLVGLGYGLQRLLLQEITTSESLATLDVAPNEKKGLFLDADKVKEISAMPEAVMVVPAFDTNVQLKYKGTLADGSATISDPEFLKLDGKKTTTGEIYADGEKEGLVLSSAFSRIFNEPEKTMLGQAVNLSLRVPQERGTDQQEQLSQSGENPPKEKNRKIDLATNFKIQGFFESEELLIFANPLGLGQDFSIEKFSRLKVKCASSDALEKLRSGISGQGYVVSSLSDTVQEVNKMFRGVNAVLATFGMIALLISAIGMFNTMTVALLERTKEIGIMKAIGASNMQILSIFILESTAMGFLGGIAGIVLGIMSGVVSNVFLNVIATRMGGESISLFYFPAWFLFFIACFSVAIGFFTGLIPARRAAKIDPLDALKSK